MPPGPGDTPTPLRVTYRQSTGEFARSWLSDYYRQSGAGPLRRLTGPALMTLGLSLRSLSRGDTRVAAAGTFFLYYGVYYVFRPLLLLAFSLVRRGRGEGPELAIELDERGVRLSDPSSSRKLGWDVINAGGARSDSAWVEIRGGARVDIPLRAFNDDTSAAFEGYFRERDKWRA